MLHLIFFSAIYLAPFFIALARKHTSQTGIFALNLLLGWTGIGWLVAFVWACSSSRQPQQVVIVNVQQPALPTVESRRQGQRLIADFRRTEGL